MRKYISASTIVVGLFFIFLAQSCVAKDSKDQLDVIDVKRNKLIGYMLGKQLPSIHFSDKEVDDELALAIFDLYIKQLDFQKRFLLQSDVAELEASALSIDNTLLSGAITLPDAGYLILSDRINQVEKLVEEIFAEGFTLDIDEDYETDSKKLEYVIELSGLKERWRKSIKAQVISRYLDFLEDRDKAIDAEKKTDDVLLNDAIERVTKRNREFFTRLHQENRQDHFDRFFNAVTRAFDPHTNYMAPAKKEDFDIHMRGSLEGIGAMLREEDGYIKVVSIFPGSASAKQGQLGAEDIILQVAEGPAEPVEITDMRLKDAVRLIRGPKGTEVRLTIRKPDGTKEIVPIIRDVVQIDETFVKSTVLTSDAGQKIGYVFIPSFYRDFENTRNGGTARNSTSDTKKAIEELNKQGIDALVLDLRNNGGGSLIDAVDISGLFIDYGPVVQVKNSYGAKRLLEDKTYGVTFDGPMVVLVNQFSASASEIVAAALQDYNRAIIVGGKHTHGKGTVQTVLDLNENIPLLHLRKYDDLGALKVTIQKFYRVNGGSTQYRGVEPDIELPTLFQHLESGEQYIDYSLPWDQVEPVEFIALTESDLNLEFLREKSAERVATDGGFKAIAAEASRSTARRDDTLISLTFADMKGKREELKEAQEKLGEHYTKYQKQEEGEDAPSPKRDKKAEEEKWLKGVQEDPYIREAGNIIDDLKVLN